MNRQTAIKIRVKEAFRQMLQETAPNLVLPDTIDSFCEKFARATTQIYDSRRDPVVISYIGLTAPVYGAGVSVDAIAGQLVPIDSGQRYIFYHNLGYEPNITVISQRGHSFAILRITDTLVEVYNNHSSGIGLYRVVCN